MNILMTNHALHLPGGSELFLIEVAHELAHRNHNVCAFTTLEGDAALRLSSSGIPVVTNPANCPFTPDVIHGQHHLETMAALSAWAQTPAFFLMHGATPWEEQPPVHPRLLKYGGIAGRMAWYIARDCDVDEAEVAFIQNFFDPSRFSKTRLANEKSDRALVFLNNLGPQSAPFQALDSACREVGLTLEGAGAAFNRIVDKPEALLPEFDVVFAGGRSAIEAMASGSTSIPITTGTIAERIHPGNYEKMRHVNFCSNPKDPPIEPSHVIAQLKQIQAEESAEVSKRVRQDYTLEQTIKMLLSVYEETIESFSRAEKRELQEESAALGTYLCSLALRVKDADNNRRKLIDQKQRADQRADKWKRRAERADAHLSWLETEFTKSPWWHGRVWRRLRREWEGRESKRP